MKNILLRTKTINIALGTPIKNPMLFEHWVPTSTLINLVHVHYYSKSFLKQNITKEIATTIAALVKHSTAGQFEFKNRSLNLSRKTDINLLTKVNTLLKNK